MAHFTSHPSCQQGTSFLKKKNVYDSCMENAVKIWTSGWFKMLIYNLHSLHIGLTDESCSYASSFIWNKNTIPDSREIRLHGEEGGTKAREFLTSRLVCHRANNIISYNFTGVPRGESHSTVCMSTSSCITQLVHYSCFTPQPESSHAKERWRGKKEGTEGGCEGKTSKKKKKNTWRMRTEEIYNKSTLTPPGLALYESRNRKGGKILCGWLEVDPIVFTLCQLSWRPFITWGQTTKPKNVIFPVKEGSPQTEGTCPTQQVAFNRSTKVWHSSLLWNRRDVTSSLIITWFVEWRVQACNWADVNTSPWVTILIPW